MSIGVASVQRKEFTTASAVYYREQRFAAETAVVEVAVVVGQASWPNVWHQRVWNSIWVLEQCLISGSLEQQWLSTGHKSVTVSICRNSTILKHYHHWIYVHVHIILQCPLQISNISITKYDEELLSNKHNSAAQMFQMSIKVECCNKDVEQFFSSLSQSEGILNLFPIFFIREPPRFEGSAVRHSDPFVVLVTIFFF